MNRARGFTLVEMIVVMGLLTAFLLMLVQLFGSGVSLFDEGESGQDLADRSRSAVRRVRAAVEPITGPSFLSPEPRDPDGRLLLQPVPLGWSAEAAGVALVPLLRSEVLLEPDEERRLREPGVRRALADELSPDPVEAEEQVRFALDNLPLLGRGRQWLFPWSQTFDGPLAPAEQGVYLQVRKLRLPLGEMLEPDPSQFEDAGIDLARVVEPQEVSGDVLLAASDVVADDLLHFEVLCWSQLTTAWDAEGDRGPERAWDSARAGWLEDAGSAWPFTLDLGPLSLRDPVDDIWPRRLRLVMVVGRNPSEPAEARLAAPLGANDTEARLISDDSIGIEDGDFVKIGGEWVRVGRVRGARLEALRRAQRGTRKRDHEFGVGVRVGRTVVVDMALPFGKDSWNG